MDASQLRDWQVRCGYRTDAQAAAALGMSVGTFRNKKHGRTPITKQTALLAKFVEIFSGRWLAMAKNCFELAVHTSEPVTPAAKAAVFDLVADAPSHNTSRQ